MPERRTVNILGATGSIGQSTVDVIASAPDMFDVRLITAHQDLDGLSAVAAQINASDTLLTSQCSAEELDTALSKPVDLTVSAITGFAGLRPLLRAIEHSKIVAIANKEPLVAAGALVLEACAAHDTKILPLDSEHNAVFQVFDETRPQGIDKIILSASGGPFREWGLEDMRAATPEQAIAHPNWSMGRKISVDSATMMNKALEIIEAHILFDMPADQIDVVIHPQSVVHSMVEYKDGSVLAQMGASDMRTPIAYALGWPERIETPGARLDLKAMNDLTFEAVDDARFPAVRLAYDCIAKGQAACIGMNAANEVAVDAFLSGAIGFLDIVDCASHIVNGIEEYAQGHELTSLRSIEAFDQSIREQTTEFLNHKQTKVRAV